MTYLATEKPSYLKTWVNRLHKSATERDIEVPWAQEAINQCRGTWLDVGFARAEPEFWDGIEFAGTHSVGLDFAAPDRSNEFDETIDADVTTFTFDRRFDLVTCISTLEHIGCDNTRYKAGEYRREDPIALQQEVVKKLRSAGKRLLVSVPFGMFEDHGWFLQYDLSMVEALEPTAVDLNRLGGQKCEPDELANCLYRTDELRASAVALMEFR